MGAAILHFRGRSRAVRRFRDVGLGAAASEKPNVLMIVGDDISFGDLGVSGSITRTPNLDRLAAQGMMFTNFHSSPVCSVTRGMLLTGNNSIDIGLGAFDYALYPGAEGKPGYEAYLTRTTAAVSELLKDAGYNTYMVGKWHLGGTAHGGEGPHEWGFDRSYGIYTGGANHWNDQVFHVDKNEPEHMAALKSGKIPVEAYYEGGKRVERPIGIYSDDLFTKKLLEYLEEGRKTGNPFFAYVAYTTPHAPLQAPDFLIDKYVDHYYKLGYQGLKRARFESQKKHGIIPGDALYSGEVDNALLTSWDSLTAEQRRREARMMAAYSAMMESQDYHIGVLLNYLHETGELDDTLIVYLSDNGPEGFSDRGELSNPKATEWVNRNFSPALEDIGRGNSYAFIGTDWADASTGGLQWWKWFIGEGGIRVPMLLVPPRGSAFARQGQRTDQFTSVMDLPMTILDYAGVEHPGTRYENRQIVEPEGVSIRRYIEGDAETPRTEEQWVAFELFGNALVFAGDYKAVRVRKGMYGDGEWHLYNTRRDPGETTPLEREQPDRLARMVATYEGWAREKGIVEVAEDWNPWHGVPEDRKSH
jgi:arylsulfatase